MPHLQKVAWITGGTRGVGRALAKRFCAEGFRVIATYSADEAAAEDLRQSLPADVIRTDVRDAHALEELGHFIASQYGRLDVLVNNAGIGAVGDVEAMGDAQFHDVLDVNVVGKYRCIQVALPFMKQSGGGCVVNVASASGVNASREMSAYCSAAAAIIMLTRCAALDLAPWDIRVNCVSPSMIDSGMSLRCFSQSDRDAVQSANPLHRLCTKDDVVECVWWLCSDKSCYINGENILLTGGK